VFQATNLITPDEDQVFQRNIRTEFHRPLRGEYERLRADTLLIGEHWELNGAARLIDSMLTIETKCHRPSLLNTRISFRPGAVR